MIDATNALKLAKANLTIFQQALKNATKTERAVHKNITKFEGKESHAQNEFKEARRAAVHYAKKVELANITVMRATKAMSNAFFSEQGASQQAQNSLTEAKNAGAKKRYSEKVLVDKRHETALAEEAVRIGKDAVEKAQSDLAIAKKRSDDYYWRTSRHNDEKLLHARRDQKIAMDKAVTDSKVSAFVGASVGRNTSNVPPFSGP